MLLHAMKIVYMLLYIILVYKGNLENAGFFEWNRKQLDFVSSL